MPKVHFGNLIVVCNMWPKCEWNPGNVIDQSRKLQCKQEQTAKLVKFMVAVAVLANMQSIFSDFSQFHQNQQSSTPLD